MPNKPTTTTRKKGKRNIRHTRWERKILWKPVHHMIKRASVINTLLPRRIIQKKQMHAIEINGLHGVSNLYISTHSLLAPQQQQQSRWCEQFLSPFLRHKYSAVWKKMGSRSVNWPSPLTHTHFLKRGEKCLKIMTIDFLTISYSISHWLHKGIILTGYFVTFFFKILFL